MVACRLLGHRYRFSSDGPTMHWECQRCGFVGGDKRYGSAEEAARYAAALDHEDREALQRRPAMLSLLPLRLFQRLRR
jgi:hypothetical protein